MLVRRWLINTSTGKSSSYVIEDKSKCVVPSCNLDYFYLLKHRDTIKTGFNTQKEAEAYGRQRIKFKTTKV